MTAPLVNGAKLSTWNEQTAAHYAELGTQEHVPILHPVLRDLAAPRRGHFLDFGCGGGELGLLLAREGFDRATLVDESEMLVATARERASGLAPGLDGRIAFRRGDESALPVTPPADVVLCSLVLMMAATRAQLERMTGGLVRSLAPDGRLLVVLTHPCFRRAGYATFHYELPPDYDYWAGGTPYDVVLEPHGKPAEAVITDHHWPLETYAAAITNAGAAITRLVELPARRHPDGAPDGPPAYLVLQVRRT